MVGSNVIAFGHGAVFGLATHIFDDGEGSTYAASGGGSSFAEAVR
jgi:hypothetical protein